MIFKVLRISLRMWEENSFHLRHFQSINSVYRNYRRKSRVELNQTLASKGLSITACHLRSWIRVFIPVKGKLLLHMLRLYNAKISIMNKDTAKWLSHSKFVLLKDIYGIIFKLQNLQYWKYSNFISIITFYFLFLS